MTSTNGAESNLELPLLTGLNRLLHDASNMIRERGWARFNRSAEAGSPKSSWGPVTFFGALSESAVSPVDYGLAVIFLKADGLNGCWTMDGHLTKDKVLKRLCKTATPASMARCMGPDWGGIVRIAQTCRTLSADQRDMLAAAGKQHYYGENAEAYIAAYGAAHGRLGFAFTEMHELLGAGRPHEAMNAAHALLVRHRIARKPSDPGRAFGREHYEVLTMGWAGVIGPVHPDD